MLDAEHRKTSSGTPSTVNQVKFLLSPVDELPTSLLIDPIHVLFLSETQRLVSLGDKTAGIQLYAVVCIGKDGQLAEYGHVC